MDIKKIKNILIVCITVLSLALGAGVFVVQAEEEKDLDLVLNPMLDPVAAAAKVGVTDPAIINTAVYAVLSPTVDYTVLAPLPGTYKEGTKKTDIGLYLSGAIKLIVALGAAVAVIMCIIGGTQYVASGISPSQKDAAKKRIVDSLTGLTLILTSFLILNSINPNLVLFNLKLKPVNVAVVPVGEFNTEERFSEREVLSMLRISSGIMVIPKYDPCPAGQTKDCVNLAGLPEVAINGMIALQKACTQPLAPCFIQITGGTEDGHKSHGVGKPIVDISTKKSENLNNFIIDKNNSTLINDGEEGTPSCGVGDAPHYKLKTGNITGVYVKESDLGGYHWHVCYY